MSEEQKAEKENGKWGGKILLILGICAVLGIGAVLVIRSLSLSPKGYQDYTVQIEQYYVEYSDEYDYWDVLTVEYPRLEGEDIELKEQINEALYDMAMERVNYWHLAPDEEVQDFQQEYFSIFCSDLACNVPFHSQYLLCVDYQELYSAGNPVWYDYITERAANVDLLTGEIYKLDDIIILNRDFMELWCDKAKEKYGSPFEGGEEETELFLSWFLNEDEEVKENYQLKNFFYPTWDDSFVIGLSYNPKPSAIYAAEPREVIFSVEIDTDELAPFRTESEFWQKYDRSEETGQVLECEDKHTNLWLGDDASIWDYWG